MSSGQTISFLEEAVKAHADTRDKLAARMGTDMSYYEGCQWLDDNWVFWQNTTSGRIYTNFNPDSRKLRVTVNRTAQMTIRAYCATDPAKMIVSCPPPDSDWSPEARSVADAAENLTNIALDESGYLAAARDANARRSIAGCWGVILHKRVARMKLDLGGEAYEADASRIVARDFCPLRLTLDPGCQDRDLKNHEYVIYSSAWTASKIKRVLGISIEEQDLKEIGQLMNHEIRLNALTYGRVFADIERYSKTKGAMVHQIHRKDASGTFGIYDIVVEPGSGEKRVISGPPPFAGGGLGMVLLHGHRRADSMWSIGEPRMMKTDQDMKNLIETLTARVTKDYGGKFLVNRQAFKSHTSEEQIRERFVNGTSVVVYDPQSRERGRDYTPQFLQGPVPQSMFIDWSNQKDQDILNQGFRAEVNRGGMKSHVADATVERALNESANVLDVRVREDLEAHERLIGVLASTFARDAAQGDPETLRCLTANGFDEDGILNVVRAQERGAFKGVKLAEGSIRSRSHAQRRQDLVDAAAAQLIDPTTVRREFVDMDSPLVANDRYVQAQINKKVDRLLRGQPWTPLNLGVTYGSWCLDALQQAQLSKQAESDPNVMALVQEAVAAQQSLLSALTAEAEGGSVTGPTTTGSGSGAEQPQSLGDLIEMVAGQAQTQPAQ